MIILIVVYKNSSSCFPIHTERGGSENIVDQLGIDDRLLLEDKKVK